MRESPILFSAPMVRAILDGRKTVARRIMKPQPTWGSHPKGNGSMYCAEWKGRLLGLDGAREWLLAQCPYGKPGQRLWVKETHRPRVVHSHGMDACDCADVEVEYQADGEIRFYSDGYIDDHSSGWCLPKAAQRGNFVPSIHMPRWASRITLEVTGVRVERLQAIDRAGALAEGIIDLSTPTHTAFGVPGASLAQHPVRAFELLWESLNGAGSWDANHWVWVVEFRRIEQEARAA